MLGCLMNNVTRYLKIAAYNPNKKMRVVKPKPSRNIYDVFSAGKEYFLVRTIIELLLWLAMLIGCFILSSKSLGTYPQVIRDHTGNIYLGKSDNYSPNNDEIYQIVRNTLESALTISKKPLTPQSAITPYLSQNLIQAINAWPKIDVVQKVRIINLWMTNAWLNKSGGSMTFFTELEFIPITRSSAFRLKGYYEVTFTSGPRTEGNPTGWFMSSLSEKSSEEFLLSRNTVLGKDYIPTSESQILNENDTKL